MTDFSSYVCRQRAKDRCLAVLHENGSVGKIERNYRDSAEVLFKNWGGRGKRIYDYTESTTKLTILDTPLEEYQQKGQPMNTLYEVTREDGTKQFAVKIAEKSKTLWVMEIKGTNAFEAIETSRIQEVVPYTVRVMPLGDRNPAHYEVEEGKVNVNDILLLSNGSVVTVVALDTRQKGVQELKAVAKIPTIPL